MSRSRASRGKSAVALPVDEVTHSARFRTRPRDRSSTTKADILIYTAIGVALSYIWRIHDLVPILGALQFTSVISVLAIALYVNDGDPRRRLRTLSHPITTIVAILGVLTVLSVPTSVHDGSSFRFLTEDLWKNLLLAVVIAGSVRSFEDVERLSFGMLAGGFMFALYAYFEGYVGWDGRLAGMPYHDANDTGMILLGMIPLSVYFLTRSRSRLARIFALISLPLFLKIVVLTGSRGAFLGLTALGIYFLFGFKSLSARTRCLAVLAAVTMVVLAGSDQYLEMINTLLNPSQDYNWSGQSETGRMEVWKRGIGYMLTHPLTGIGVNAFPVAEGTLSPQSQLHEFGIGFKWSTAHNSFVQIGAELGVFGLIAFTTLQARCYLTARRVMPQPRPSGRPSDPVALGHALGGLVVVYVVCGFFLSQAYGAYSFAMYGLIMGLAKVSRQQTPSDALPARRASRASASPNRPAGPGSRTRLLR
jgi:O-antigen ligase